MKLPICVMVAAGILGSACAAPLQSIELFTPGKDRARLLFHRRDNSLIRSVPATGAGISVNRADAPEAAYFDCQANPAPGGAGVHQSEFPGKGVPAAGSAGQFVQSAAG